MAAKPKSIKKTKKEVKKEKVSGNLVLAQYEVVMIPMGAGPDRTIQELLKEGWAPYGFPQFLQMNNGWNLCQAMVKYEQS